MQKLTDNELKQIQGGISIFGIIGIIAGFIFGTGVVNGYVNPHKCN